MCRLKRIVSYRSVSTYIGLELLLHALCGLQGLGRLQGEASGKKLVLGLVPIFMATQWGVIKIHYILTIVDRILDYI